MAGKFTVTHKTSDDDEIVSETFGEAGDASSFADDIIEDLEGDSGASVTITWEH